MEFTVLGTRIKISPLFFAVLTAFLLIDKNGIACYAVLFSFLHEMGHIMALVCIKKSPKAIGTSMFGLHISLRGNMSTAEKIIVLISGFAVNFILAAVLFILEKNLFAYINLVIGLLTAIPLSSTDGGAVLGILLNELPFGNGERMFRIITFSFLVIVSAGLIFIGFYTGNYFLFVAVFYMFICVIK